MSIYIEDYSDKSFVVRGDTKPHKDKIMQLGGKWVNNLTDKKTQEKFGAWIFWSAKREAVSNMIKELSNPLPPPPPPKLTRSVAAETLSPNVEHLEKMLYDLINMIKEEKLIADDKIDSTEMGKWFAEKHLKYQQEEDGYDYGKTPKRLL